jgi:hypothetical protein
MVLSIGAPHKGPLQDGGDEVGDRLLWLVNVKVNGVAVPSEVIYYFILRDASGGQY